MSNNKIDITPLGDFIELSHHDSIVYRKIKLKKINIQTKKNEKQSYNPYNQVCTCIIRVRETAWYINTLSLKKENQCGEAFNFYEFINCCSIIFECVNMLFFLFDKKLSDSYKNNRFFIKSNKKKNVNDFDFFKFVRSATSVHPENTDRYSEITTLKHEFYPYAVWNNDKSFLNKNDLTDFDIGLISWNSKPSCYNKNYYLYIDEFFNFVNAVIFCLKDLKPVMQNMINDNKKVIKKLKPESLFKTGKDYCLYLRKRLQNCNLKKNEFADGGLLIASHILSNKILNNNFKNEILKNVRKLSSTMIKDIEEIGYDDVYKEFDISKALGPLNAPNYSYISEKFYYLEYKANNEIKNNKYDNCWKSLREEENNCNYSDAEWITYLLLCSVENFYNIDEIKQVKSFTDLFEITLQTVWEKNKINHPDYQIKDH